MSTVLTGRLSLTVWVKDFSLKPSLSPPSAHFCIIVHPQRSRSGLSQQSIVKSIEWRRLGHSVRLKGDRCDVSLVADLTCAIMPSRFMTEINMTWLQQRKVDYKCVLFIQTLPITTQMNPPPSNMEATVLKQSQLFLSDYFADRRGSASSSLIISTVQMILWSEFTD